MSDRISSSDPARTAGFDPATQPVVSCAMLPGLPAECLQLDYIREAFQRPVHWQVEPMFTASFSPAAPGPVDARQAAVLMPLVQREQGPHVVFTRRAEHLQNHPGQISFPGGRIEPEDRDPIAAALRETHEEIGVDDRFVRILGVQPSFLTSTHFVMTPIIGELLPGFSIRSDGREVAEVFEVPLQILMDPAQHRLHEVRLPDGGARCYFSITWQSYFIWGATAVLIRNFYHYLAAARMGE